MADIAQIGFSANTSELSRAKASLEALVPPARKAETATEKLGLAFDKAGRGADSAAADINKVGAAASGAGSAASGATPGVMRLAEGYDVLTGKLNRNFLAINSNLSAMQRVPAAAAGAAASINNLNRRVIDSTMRMQATPGNIAAQFQDIGVTAAMGMNPLMIALQQGTQLSAAFAGGGLRSLGEAFRQILSPASLLTIAIVGLVAAGLQLVDWAGVARWALNGLADVIESIAPYAVAAAGAIALIYAPAIIRGIYALIAGFVGLLASMIACLGVPGLIVAGLVAVVAAGVAFRDDLTRMLGFDIVEAAKTGVNFIIAAFVTGFNVIKRTWSMLPAAIGDAVLQAVNGVIAAVEWMINKAIDGLNSLWRSIDSHSASGGGANVGRLGPSGTPFNNPNRNVGQIGRVDLGRINNPFAGSMREVGNVAAEEWGRASGTDYVGGFIEGVQNGARRVAGALRGWARGIGQDDAKKRRGRGGGGRTDAERFEDIAGGVTRDIASVNAEIEGLNMTAEAALRLRNEQTLLNKAAQQGITLTGQQRTRLMELAGALTEAQLRLRDLKGMKEITEGSQRRTEDLRSEGRMIGLVGEELIRATHFQELMNQAREKGLRIGAAEIETFRRLSRERASVETANEHDRFMEDFRRNNVDRMLELLNEDGAIGQTQLEVTRLRIEFDMLADARRRNITLAPEELTAIQQAATAQAQLTDKIRRTREAMDFARDITKGFITDMRQGLMEGKSIWETFGNAVINVLNKIIDKLLDQQITNLINSLFSSMNTGGGGGGDAGLGASIANGFIKMFSGSAKGNIFGDGLIPFAAGGAFTNSVVNSPTAFAFGKGGRTRFGVMGEAGEEAVMPLERGPDGSLGVQMYGGGKAPTVINAPINVHNDNRVQGAMSSKDIVDMQNRASQQTKDDIKRAIPSIISQFTRDGAIV